jgi:hypothetical protein
MSIVPEQESPQTRPETIPGLSGLSTPAIARTYGWLRDLEAQKRRAFRSTTPTWNGDRDSVDLLGTIAEQLYVELVHRDPGMRR